MSWFQGTHSSATDKDRTPALEPFNSNVYCHIKMRWVDNQVESLKCEGESMLLEQHPHTDRDLQGRDYFGYKKAAGEPTVEVMVDQAAAHATAAFSRLRIDNTLAVTKSRSNEGYLALLTGPSPSPSSELTIRGNAEADKIMESSVSREVLAKGARPIGGFGLHDTGHDSVKQVYQYGSKPGYDSVRQVYGYGSNPGHDSTKQIYQYGSKLDHDSIKQVYGYGFNQGQDSLSRRVHNDGTKNNSVKQTYGFATGQQGTGPDSVSKHYGFGAGEADAIRRTYAPVRYTTDHDRDDHVRGLYHGTKRTELTDLIDCLSCYEGLATGHTEWCEASKKFSKESR